MLRHMGRCVSAPSLFRNSKIAAAKTNNNISRSFWHRRPTYLPSPIGHEFDKAMSQMQHEFDRVINSSFWRPFVDNQHPSVVETYRLRNPIVEDNGVKKFKLEFDIRRFKPEDVKISTDAQKKTLTIEAKYSDENSKFEYQRTISVPDGVTPADITCTYKSDGVLLLEAPYIEPEKPEPVKDTVINIDHK
uniref:SHSP domain-containing protein n=1 Tax=Panagrolaimus superbus TaxID=310955 RepID=A0A914Z9P0_9BILA